MLGIFFLSFFSLSFLSAELVLWGVVFDKETHQALPEVKVNFLKEGWEAETDTSGRFQFLSLPEGEYKLKFEKIGYETLFKKISLPLDRELRVFLTPKVLRLEPVEVRGSDFRITENASQSAVLTRDEIFELPGGGGDIFSALQTLPGVGSAGPASPLYIRGGTPYENLVLVDDIRITSPFHLEDIGGGLFSIFHSEAIENVRMFPGGFSAEYGDCLSAVIDIKTRAGNKDTLKGMTSFHIAGGEVFLEGPISSRSTYLFSARRSFFDLIMKMMEGEGESSKYKEFPNYFDFQAKLSYDFSPAHKLTLNGVFARSGCEIFHQGVTEYIFKSEKAYSWLNLTSFLGENILLETSLGTGRSKIGDGLFSLENFLSEELLQLKEAFSLKLAPNHFLNLGAGLSWEEEVKEKKFGDRTWESKRVSGWKLGCYLSDKWQVLEKLEVTTGLRYDYLEKTRQGVLNPRLRLSFQLHPKATIFGGWGAYSQFPFLWLLKEEIKGWDFKPMLAHHYTLGSTVQLPKGFFFKTEAYYKKFTDLYTPHCSRFYSDAPSSQINADYFSYFTSGFARGLEVFLQRKSGRVQGWLSYAFSEAQRKEFKTKELIPFDFDLPHIFSAVLDYELWSGWKLGLKWRYLSGRPKTPLVGVRTIPGVDYHYIPIWGKENSGRCPPFHQLDLRVVKEVKSGEKSLSFVFELMNVYARKNILVSYFNTTTGKEETVKIFETPLPVVGIRVTF
jgi:hypothetical protein